MSIFDDNALDKIDDNCYKYLLKQRRNIVRNNYKFINDAGLNDKELDKYCQNLSLVDAFHVTSIPGLPDFGSVRNIVKVIFSDQEITYEDRYGLPEQLILGAYDDSSKSIYIY